MSSGPPPAAPADEAVRQGEYAERGDYHRTPDRHWDYLPTYQAKMRLVCAYLDALPSGTHVLDAGCGEGLLVERYAGRLRIEGIDPNYAAPHVRQGSLLALPCPDAAFERVLCLDVLEHLAFEEQPRALAEIHRVLRPGGEALVSVPNLAHLQSRVQFALRGRLIRTASEVKHPGDRPAFEYLRLFARAGFVVTRRRGIFPTVPVLTALIRRHPSSLSPLHRALTALLPVPGWCFLNLFWLKKA
ncbi:MAG: class I SAM-dependent methyltransferase [Vicinamibacterales bacterium]|jgi:SAM-dependent methyltransferase|nr:class I SAM-dependent methyltransferase [Vicinamibacterales bacterium]